ncbi:hypothetical protein F5883DRAFT_46385 [Diaporthe sp. PMI_573]|nr:hypothetical protein F5883DRAFT_46385 [Diaporthaceae sp. PMI_573]
MRPSAFSHARSTAIGRLPGHHLEIFQLLSSNPSPPPRRSQDLACSACCLWNLWRMSARALISSAFSLSHASRYAREAIASIKEFRLVGKHVAGCLWVYLNTQVASHVEVCALYSALTTRICSFCWRFGDLLSIPTVQRCCLNCFMYNHRLKPSFLSELTRGVIGIPSTKIIKRGFPVLRTIPNSYGWGQTSIERRRYIVAGQHARQLQKDCERLLPLPRHSDNLLFTTFTILPYLNPTTKEIQESFTCRACRGHASSTREQFIAHLRGCVGAADHWLWLTTNRS